MDVKVFIPLTVVVISTEKILRSITSRILKTNLHLLALALTMDVPMGRGHWGASRPPTFSNSQESWSKLARLPQEGWPKHFL